VNYVPILLISLLALVALASIVGIAVAVRGKSRNPKLPPQKVYKVHVEGSKIFSEIDMSQVEQYARAQLQQSTARAAEQLQGTLTKTVEQISSHLSDLATTPETLPRRAFFGRLVPAGSIAGLGIVAAIAGPSLLDAYTVKVQSVSLSKNHPLI